MFYVFFLHKINSFWKKKEIIGDNSISLIYVFSFLVEPGVRQGCDKELTPFFIFFIFYFFYFYNWKILYLFLFLLKLMEIDYIFSWITFFDVTKQLLKGILTQFLYTTTPHKWWTVCGPFRDITGDASSARKIRYSEFKRVSRFTKNSEWLTCGCRWDESEGFHKYFLFRNYEVLFKKLCTKILYRCLVWWYLRSPKKDCLKKICVALKRAVVELVLRRTI